MCWVEVQRERPLERRERQLVSAQSALQRMPPELLDKVGAADDDSRLRTAEQLVAGERDEISARSQALARRRLVRQLYEDAGAEVVEQRQAVSPCDGRELRDPWLLGEADDPEVRLVDTQEERCVVRDRPLVVGGPRSIGGADLHEACAGAGEDVRNSEPVPDLDQLAAGDDDFAPFGQRRKREEYRRSVVVDDERGLSARQTPEQAREVVLARPAHAFVEVVLEVRVATADLVDPVEGCGRQRRPAKVRVQDDPRRVEHAPERGPPRRRQLGRQPLSEISWVEARPDLFT